MLHRSDPHSDWLLRNEACLAIYRYGGVRGVVFNYEGKSTWRTYQYRGRSIEIVAGSERTSVGRNPVSALQTACAHYSDLNTLHTKQLLLAAMIDWLIEKVLSRYE